MVSMAGIPMIRNDSALGLVRTTGSARPKPKVVISPLHLLEFTSERRMCLEDEKSAAEVRTRRITAPRFPSSIRLTSAKASIGGHAIQHAVEILVLWIGPNSTRSGIIRADENRIAPGPNLSRYEDPDPNEWKIHQAPNKISNN